MAEKRMFSKKITNSDAFLDMPKSAQALYFHLSMEADDDGFLNAPKRIMRMVNCSDDDMNILLSKKFVLMFDSGVIVIKHWRINNYIRSDRYNETQYTEERDKLIVKENGAYTWKSAEASLPMVCEMDTDGIPVGIPSDNQDGYQMDTQIRLDKNRLDKIRIDKTSDTTAKIFDLFNEICVSYPKIKSLSEDRKKAIKARLNSGYTVEDFETLFKKAENSKFLKGGNGKNWSATFDWLIKDANMAKTLDGNYDDKKTGKIGLATISNEGYATLSSDDRKKLLRGGK